MQVKNRVCAVAFTDSAHNIWHQETSKGTQDWMQQVIQINAFSNIQPLGKSNKKIKTMKSA